MENPARYIIKKHEISEIGMSISGRMAISQFLKKKNITSITRHKEMISVSFTSSKDLRTFLVVSISTFISISDFSVRFNSAIRLLNSSDMLM